MEKEVFELNFNSIFFLRFFFFLWDESISLALIGDRMRQPVASSNAFYWQFIVCAFI